MVSDTVLLEVPADASLLPVVRMVVGGMSARADLTLSEMDELFLAVEEVLRLLENLGDPCCDLILSVVEHDVQGDDTGSHSVVLTKRRRD